MFDIVYYVSYTGFSITSIDYYTTEIEIELYFTICNPNVLLSDIIRILTVAKTIVIIQFIVKTLVNINNAYVV